MAKNIPKIADIDIGFRNEFLRFTSENKVDLD